MPICISNCLPSVSLILGIQEEEKSKMRMLVDTGAAMNTDNLQYHLWVMSQCPDIVHGFLQCGKDTAYDVVHILAALDLKDVNKTKTQGQMTAAIHYKTPYTVASKGPFILSFALGHDVSLRSVLGLPTLLAMGADMNLVKGLLSCSELNREFPLDLQPLGHGLSEGVSLNHYSPNVPTSVSTNQTHKIRSYIIQQQKVLRNLRVHVHLRTIYLLPIIFFNDNVTRELKYVPSNSNSFAAFSYQLTFSHILSCSILSQSRNNLIPHNSNVNFITGPQKIWRPKMVNNYKPIIYTDVDDDVYVLKHYGKSMTRSPTVYQYVNT